MPCSAYVADELLRAEGFTDVRYVSAGTALRDKTARGEVDFTQMFAAILVGALDTGLPLTVLAGVHPGCFELFAHEPIRAISDLKGKRVGITSSTAGTAGRIMAAQVGLDPVLEWVTSVEATSMQQFVDGRIDAFLGFPPEPQELRARRIGHVVVNSAVDRPWSQYFCCLLAGNRDLVHEHPIATKRVAARHPQGRRSMRGRAGRMAQRLVDGGFTPHYDYALQTLTELPYDRWREYDPEDTMRFYALRIHEGGLITSSPNQLSPRAPTGVFSMSSSAS